VYLCQFLKGKYYCELSAIKKLKNIKVEQFGTTCFIKRKPSRRDLLLAKAGIEAARRAVLSKKYNLIILDEVNIALKLKLVKLADLMAIIRALPKDKELVLTGRYAHPQVIRVADLVSEMVEKKHYYNKGVKARRGIEF
jgi:cob(I)alamin adenosyltransferase